MKENNRMKHSERGATLYIVAGAMVIMLGMSALAIDLASDYFARAQAQRAADAAALAGASEFVTVGCTSSGGCTQGGPQEGPATAQATTVAGQNLVAGQAPTTGTINVAFHYPNPEEPQITVTVYRDAAHGNPLPTFFGKIFGITTVNVSASATAEAYNPTGGGLSIGVSCIRPFLVPNCDPNHIVPIGSAEANPNCPSGSGDMENFFDPTSGAIVNPGNCLWNGTTCTGPGVVGAPWQLHDQTSGSATPVPSQWYTIAFTSQSGSQYEQNIYTCAPQSIACNATLNSLNGKKVGPTNFGVETLIHASGEGLNQGQDTMCSSTAPVCMGAPPFPILGGSNNPYGLAGQTFTASTSDSIANVVVYDGQLAPGGGAANPFNVTVVGYMQLFFQDVTHTGTVDNIDTVILNMGGCGPTTQTPGPPPVTSAGGSFIPIRLIHQ